MSQATKCPECGAAASGNFCASCGTALGSRFCTQCGAKVSGGASFCTQCGASMAGGPAGKVRTPAATPPPSRSGGASGGDGSANMGWWVAGAMMVVVIIFMAWPILNPGGGNAGGNPPVAGGAGGSGGQGSVDLNNMSPREAADRLYNRVMAAAEANDSSQVTMFLPMAVQSYDMARPLDPDGLFHLSRLQLMAADPQGALSTAEESLQVNPDYLLGLYAAGDAALAVGDRAAGAGYFQRLLEVWDRQLDTGNQDYELHARQLDGIKAYAEEVLSGG